VQFTKLNNKNGFALIAALLLLIAISGLAVAMIYVANGEQRMNGSDRENTEAYYASEAAMEKMMGDLNALYAAKQAPTVQDIHGLQNSQPALAGITYPLYFFNVAPGPDGIHPLATAHTITSGMNAGLNAEIIDMALQVQAQRVSGAQTSMTRNIEVALIPVFQFGAFSDGDLSYAPGPQFDFNGRVHANNNLFLSSVFGLTFHSKLTAGGDVIRAQLSDGVSTSTEFNGSVEIPKSPAGCDGAKPACRSLALTEGSVVSGPGSATNPSWASLSTSTYNGMVLSGSTGATKLTLPFVGPGVGAIEIVRRPWAGENPSSAVGQSRLYNIAQIRVLFSDTPAELPGGAGDAQNIQLDNVGPYAAGVPVTGASPTYFGRGLLSSDADWVRPPGVPAGGSWPLVGGYLRVEIRRADGSYLPVTSEWLQLGFARGLLPPNSEKGIANTVHPNAILMLQMQADRNGNGTLTDAGETTVVTGAAVVNNWYPINIYDTREGEVRDNEQPAGNRSCAIGGVMNVAEIDVSNLRRWLAGQIGATGAQTEAQSQNGYILYFSDRRGMLANAAGVKTGEYGFEDVINPANAAGAPNGVLDAGEDVNGSGTLETYGAGNIGDGLGAANGNPTVRLADCMKTGRKNRVTGARHVLRLVNGTLGNVPLNPNGTGGFTVASEQPTYLLGNYNANNGGFGSPHAAAAVIADAVTLLSNNWNDYQSFLYPTQPSIALGHRGATTTFYRVAIASGRNMTFNHPAWSIAQDFGTDGGIHNFLRYLEEWSGQTSNYMGSMVSFFYAQYSVGVFKCCGPGMGLTGTVYSPPNRAYSFDADFLDPSKMPPGTPRFRDMVNLGYRQDFTPY
jgi:hypothetical protein